MTTKIINELDKIIRQVTIIDILMDHIHNTYLEEKWEFTLRTYNNLLNEVNEYKTSSLNNTLKNYIINDYETLSQMIEEYKEDIYDLFNPNLFLLIDNLNISSLKELSSFQKELHNKEFNSYIYYTLNNSINITKEMLSTLKTKLIETLSENDLKYLNLDLIDSILNKNTINIDTYIMICQIYKKTIKYLKEDIKINQNYKIILFNSIIMLAGEKNVQ